MFGRTLIVVELSPTTIADTPHIWSHCIRVSDLFVVLMRAACVITPLPRRMMPRA